MLSSCDQHSNKNPWPLMSWQWFLDRFTRASHPFPREPGTLQWGIWSVTGAVASRAKCTKKKQRNVAIGSWYTWCEIHFRISSACSDVCFIFFTSLQLLHTNWEHHIKEYKSADEWLPPRCWLAEFFAAANDSKTKRNTGDLQIESKNPLFFIVFHRFWYRLEGFVANVQ